MDQTSPHGEFLSRFSERLRTKMLSLGHAFHYQQGQTIFAEGDSSRYLYLVKRGHVALAADVPGRGPVTLMTVGPGEIFSWSALSKTRVETATAQALEDVDVLGFKSDELEDVAWEDPQMGLELYRTLMEVLSARLIATRLQLATASSAKARPDRAA